MAWVGNPSSNSRVPIRVSTRSGVMILAGIGVLKPSGVTVSLIALLSPFVVLSRLDRGTGGVTSHPSCDPLSAQ